ncbi:MAG: DUF4159 domain-containing protein [Planctomycetes bacterium]|nr:DUF4159 domain-containing protein [Planctomycetota bacterium]
MMRWIDKALVLLLVALLGTGGLLVAAQAPKAGGGAGKGKAAAAKKESGGGGGQAVAVTEASVDKAIESGRAYLLSQARPDGSFGKGGGEKHPGGLSALVFMTLAYMGQHPNHPAMSKGLDYLLNLDGRTGFGDRPGYAVPIRIMGLSYVHNKLLGDKRAAVRLKMVEDLNYIFQGQAPSGGWRYKLNATDYDFSVSQWPILAMREASLVGIEFNTGPLIKARELYYHWQQKDGGWCYIGNREPSYGSMTAAGLASLYIINDVLDPASGCPCASGRSRQDDSGTERRMEAALGWLAKHFTAAENPFKDRGDNRALYWLYCVERVGIAAGYKYFGTHNWFREGAARLLKSQTGGHWDSLDDTCFALLFLYKGRAPILFNKLKFEGTWNAHRRDIANLTHYIERTKEEQFHWQIVDLKSPLEELHDAPILFITPETVPEWNDAQKQKLRAFTDTGGTILVEASCGNAAVRRWFQEFAREVWPEWPLKPLGPDHGSFLDPNPLKQRPEILGISDGVRTSVFYSPDDISCSWQARGLAAREYVFKWGINLHKYATDGAPLRSKLAQRGPEKTGRYKDPVRPGPKTTVRIARVRHTGNWEAGANYGGFKELAAAVKAKAGIALQLKDKQAPPVTEGGVPPDGLKGYDVAYFAGSNDFALTPEEKQSLKAYVEGGGCLWAESVTGATAFDQAFSRMAKEMAWDLRLLPKEHPLMTGRMDGATGYNLTAGVQFQQLLRVVRLSRAFADLYGIYSGDKMIGVYSPLDVVYSTLGLEAYQCKGYKAEDAEAVGINLAVYFSTLK